MKVFACIVAVLVALMTVVHAVDAELVSFRRSHGGAGDDLTLDIYVDSGYTQWVGQALSAQTLPTAF
ncbi:MAG: hypothetical protein QXV27_05460 [Candidatus Caldarchaeum sp.]